MEDLRSGFGMVATVHDVIDGTRLLNSEGEGSVAVRGLLTILRTDPLKLIHYTLEPNPEAEGDKNKPTQKLTLAFATADVVVLGWRLAKLCDDLRNGDLLAVRALPDRYANLDQNKTFVASITVTPLAKE